MRTATDMQQEPLFCEDLNEALRATVQALGGPKKVGYALWPPLGVEGAGGRMRDCLNPERREKLDPLEVVALLKLERSHGVRILATHLMREAGYADPQPVEPDDQRADLQRQAAQLLGDLKQVVTRLERVTPSAAEVRRG